MIDFAIDDTQKHFLETAKGFGKEILEPAEIALDKLQNPTEVFESNTFWDVMAQAAELGFMKMSMPEMHGGLGVDPSTAGLIWEELARYGIGFAATLQACAVAQRVICVMAAGNKELIDKYVVPFCEDTTGRLVSAWGSSEPDVGSDGSNYYDPKVHHFTSAEKKGDKWVLNGTKSNFVSNGGIAKVHLTFACVDPSQGIRGSGVFVIPGDAPGLTVGKPIDKVGLRTLNQAPVFFDNVEIPEDYMIFPPGDGYPMLHNTIVTVGNIGVGYLALGLMRAAFEEALAYSKERVQWGKPIFEHQHISHKLFEMHQTIEATRALLWKASWLCKTQFPGDLKTSIAAKVFASNNAVKHTAEMVQVLGGYGISREYKLEKYMRDASLLRIMDGTNETLANKAVALL